MRTMRRQDTAGEQKIAVIDKSMLGRLEIVPLLSIALLSNGRLSLHDLVADWDSVTASPLKAGNRCQMQQDCQHADGGTAKQRTELTHKPAPSEPRTIRDNNDSIH